MTPERQPLTPYVLNSSGTHVVADPGNDTYYLVVDTRHFMGRWEGSGLDPVRIGGRPGMGFIFQLSMQASPNAKGTPGDLVSADFIIVGREVSFTRVGGDRVVLPPDQIQLHATTTLAPGSVVTFQVTGALNQTIEHVVRKQTTSDPGFVVPLNLSNVASGDTVTVRVTQGDPPPITEHVTAVIRTPNASIDAPRTVEAGRILRLPAVTVSHQSIVAVYTDSKRLVDTTLVEPGRTTNVPVSVIAAAGNQTQYRVVVYRDVDRSRSLTAPDVPYRTTNGNVTATITVTPGPTPTQTNSTETTTSTATQSSTTSGTTPTNTSTPGFELMTGVLALVAILVIVQRTAE